MTPAQMLLKSIDDLRGLARQYSDASHGGAPPEQYEYNRAMLKIIEDRIEELLPQYWAAKEDE